MLPPAAKVQHAADTIPSRHLHSSLNKIKHPVNVVKWTPEGRRLLTGSTSGEFTLWNGTGFNFETIMQVSIVRLSTFDAELYGHRHMTLQFGLQGIHMVKSGLYLPTKTELLNTGSPISITSKQYKPILIQYVILLFPPMTTNS